MTTTFTGKDPIAAGFHPGSHFTAMLREANAAGVLDKAAPNA